jgi:hypothetical protein
MAEKFSSDVTRVHGLQNALSPVGTSEPSLEQVESYEKLALSTKLRWKRDIYVLGPLTVLYVFCFLDRLAPQFENRFCPLGRNLLVH